MTAPSIGIFLSESEQLLNPRYLDGVVSAGTSNKRPVRLATTAAIAALTACDSTTFDSVSTALGDRILVKDQADAKENGLYYVSTLHAATGVLTRAEDMDDEQEAVVGSAVKVTEGTVNGDKDFTLTAAAGKQVAVVGTDNINFAVAEAQVELATDPGLEYSSGLLRAKVDGTTIERAAGGLQVKDLGITAGKLGALAVETAKINDFAVTEGKIAGASVSPVKTAVEASGIAVPFILTKNSPAGAAAIDIYDANAPFKFRIIDMTVMCGGNNVGGTMKANKGTVAVPGTDITDAIACDTAGAIGRAGTMDGAAMEIAANGSLSLVKNAAGDAGFAILLCERIP